MVILSISEKVLFFVCGFGILQGILLGALVYFHQRSDRSVNKFLALYIVCLSGVISMPFIVESIGWQNGFFLELLPLFVGSLLYPYLRIFKEVLGPGKILPHFLFIDIFIAWFTGFHR